MLHDQFVFGGLRLVAQVLTLDFESGVLVAETTEAAAFDYGL